jgi:hypothetical protein
VPLDERRLYDLRAIPSLYLLDMNCRVLLKDAGFESVQGYLQSHAPAVMDFSGKEQGR